MKVKNVSSSTIDVPEFKLSLKPGDIGDLSSFDPAQVRSHKRLGIMFEKGLLVNLGRTSPAGSMAMLNSVKDRIAKMKILGSQDEYVVKPSKKRATPSKRSAIQDALKDIDRRAPLGSLESEYEERYGDEYFTNMHPGEEEPEDYKRPRPKIEEKFRTAEINWDGSIAFGHNGQIETGVVTGKTTHLAPDPDKLIVKDKGGHEYKVSLARIKDKMLRRCVGTSSSGRPCKKYAIQSFQSCLTHMSRQEREEYDKLRKVIS